MFYLFISTLLLGFTYFGYIQDRTATGYTRFIRLNVKHSHGEFRTANSTHLQSVQMKPQCPSNAPSILVLQSDSVTYWANMLHLGC